MPFLLSFKRSSTSATIESKTSSAASTTTTSISSRANSSTTTTSKTTTTSTSTSTSTFTSTTSTVFATVTSTSTTDHRTDGEQTTTIDTTTALHEALATVTHSTSTSVVEHATAPPALNTFTPQPTLTVTNNALEVNANQPSPSSPPVERQPLKEAPSPTTLVPPSDPTPASSANATTPAVPLSPVSLQPATPTISPTDISHTTTSRSATGTDAPPQQDGAYHPNVPMIAGIVGTLVGLTLILVFCVLYTRYRSRKHSTQWRDRLLRGSLFDSRWSRSPSNNVTSGRLSRANSADRAFPTAVPVAAEMASASSMPFAPSFLGGVSPPAGRLSRPKLNSPLHRGGASTASPFFSEEGAQFASPVNPFLDPVPGPSSGIEDDIRQVEAPQATTSGGSSGATRATRSVLKPTQIGFAL
ncbi:hypothetical protein BV25DRAFT_1920656 [Artomyces pyxidatus]|uniref:Uncharacterized protein n=1 Tax=Artomyces pyxidatus TaxID=48021 RepID=A0ACB8SJS9_9AGAM|nr:hypothetical protein BV25DRAFT_1920656 [Artomyces pyxidatus]